jgi:serine/threonine-protein kinase
MERRQIASLARLKRQDARASRRSSHALPAFEAKGMPVRSPEIRSELIRRRGHSVDKRADIWAFGVVVYEMLTGQQLFGGPTVSDTLAAVLRQEPDWQSIPARLQKLLQQCLAKDPRQRLRDIGDARVLMDEPTVENQIRRNTGWKACATVATLTYGQNIQMRREITVFYDER